MANFLYDAARANLLGDTTAHARIDLDTDTLGMFFVDELDDTPSQTADQDVADRLAASQVPAFASAPNLAGKTITVVSNVAQFDATDLTFSALTGDQSESIDLWVDTGTDTTSTLIANFDTYTGIPLTPSGGDVVIVFNASGIINL